MSFPIYKDYVSTKYVPGNRSHELDYKEKHAKYYGLCLHCKGAARRVKDWIVCPDEYVKCEWCRGTGRNLDLEARGHEFHTARVSGLTFSQCVREWCQLNRSYIAHGTLDERQWNNALEWRFRNEFKLGRKGYGGLRRYFNDADWHTDEWAIKSVLHGWIRRIEWSRMFAPEKRKEKIYWYLNKSQDDKDAKREKARAEYLRRLRYYKYYDGAKWRKRFRLVFGVEKPTLIGKEESK